MNKALSFFDKIKIYTTLFNSSFDPLYDIVLSNIIENENQLLNINYDHYYIRCKFKNDTNVDIWAANKWYAFAENINIYNKDHIISIMRSGRPSRKIIIKFINFLSYYFNKKLKENLS